MTAVSPPQIAIAEAEEHARRGRDGKGGCVKSNRGAVVFTLDDVQTRIGGGFNGQPLPFWCTGTDDCRKRCGQVCQHAEVRAIHDAMTTAPAYGVRLSQGSCGLVHVKLGPDGLVMPGGPPSCTSCSGRILDVNFIAEVWLYEKTTPDGASAALIGTGFQIKTELIDAARRLAESGKLGQWRRYPAEEFHRLSLENGIKHAR